MPFSKIYLDRNVGALLLRHMEALLNLDDDDDIIVLMTTIMTKATTVVTKILEQYQETF